MLLITLLDRICRHIPDKYLIDRIISKSCIRLVDNQFRLESHSDLPLDGYKECELPSIRYLLFVYGLNTFNNETGTDAWMLKSFSDIMDLSRYIDTLVLYSNCKVVENSPFFLPIIDFEPQPIKFNEQNDIVWQHVTPFKLIQNNEISNFNCLANVENEIIRVSMEESQYPVIMDSINQQEIPFTVMTTYSSSTKKMVRTVNVLSF